MSPRKNNLPVSRPQLCYCLFILLIFSNFHDTPVVIGAFCPSIILHSRSPSTVDYKSSHLLNEQGDGSNNNESDNVVSEDKNVSSNNADLLDDFLDQPFFDPDQVTEDDPLPVRWFADLVKNDYGTAETLFAGALFVVLVVFSQELLRMQIFGMDGYHPFQAGVRPGQLF